MVLHTARLTLRPFVPEDAPRLQQLAGAREVAENTLMIPHPYPDGAAEAWIASHEEKPNDRHFVIDDGELVGVIGLHLKPDDDAAEIGYWIGVPYWGRGYATEAAQEIVRHGFEDLGLNRIFAGHFTRNAASAAVIRKIGMRYEGTMRQQHKKWGEYVDVAYYSILREEWLRRSLRDDDRVE